ncbi:MAG: DUF1036 domain-containing protein [Rhodopseudomonas palustris]|nr:DUF1036 domain-containing protein [Rhodopseudomonas palustris]
MGCPDLFRASTSLPRRCPNLGRRTFPDRPRVAAAVLACLVASAARADFKICNRMSYVVEVAIGIDDRSSTATRGWFRIDPAQCRVVAQGTLTADRLLLHARALAVYGASPTPQDGADRLCVAQDNFVIAAARQCRGGQSQAAFSEVKPSKTEDGIHGGLSRRERRI